MSDKKDPIDRIEWREAAALKANDYNPNVVMTKEMELLELSILKQGWIQPILVTKDGTIIDGFHRYTLSIRSTLLHSKYGGLVPCAVVDLTAAEAMLLTVRINRAKGTHLGYLMSDLIVKLVDDHQMTFDQIETEIGGYKGEIELLYKNTVFKRKESDKHEYSAAWRPKTT